MEWEESLGVTLGIVIFAFLLIQTMQKDYTMLILVLVIILIIFVSLWILHQRELKKIS